jgi:hypothetical protein
MPPQDTAEPSPEFPEIVFSAAANGIAEQHLNGDSKVRIVLLSHVCERAQNTPVTCQSKGPRTVCARDACPVCATQSERCQSTHFDTASTLPEPDQSAPPIECCASCLPPQVPFQWHYIPVPASKVRHSNAPKPHCSPQRDSSHRSSRRSTLPTIRESCAGNSVGRSSDDSPAASSCKHRLGGRDNGESSPCKHPHLTSPTSTAPSHSLAEQQRHVIAEVSVEGGNHCAVHLSVAASKSASNNGTTTNGACVADAQPHSNSCSDTTSTAEASDSAARSLFAWELRAVNPQDAACLVDVCVDLNADLTPVPMAFSSLHCCSGLPIRTLMLGLGNATHVSGARHAVLNRGVQPAALFLYPKLPEHACQKFIQDNKDTAKVSLM